MRQIRNKSIIQRNVSGIKNNTYYVSDDYDEEYPMITYKYNKETGKYEFFEAKPKRSKHLSMAAKKAQYVKEILEREKKSNAVKFNGTFVSREFEEDYAAFVAHLKATQNETVQAVETVPAVEDVIMETPLTQVVNNETETVEVPTVLDDKVEEISVKRTKKKKDLEMVINEEV